MSWESNKPHIYGVRKVRWDALWHVLYRVGVTNTDCGRDTFDRVSAAVAMRVLEQIPKWSYDKAVTKAAMVPVHLTKRVRLIRWRDVREYGFKHAHIMQPVLTATGLFYKQIGQSVLFVDHGMGGVFNLSAKHAYMFIAGRISLVPPDCVSVSGSLTREFNPRKDVKDIPYAEFMLMVRRGYTTCPP